MGCTRNRRAALSGMYFWVAFLGAEVAFPWFFRSELLAASRSQRYSYDFASTITFDLEYMVLGARPGLSASRSSVEMHFFEHGPGRPARSVTSVSPFS